MIYSYFIQGMRRRLIQKKMRGNRTRKHTRINERLILQYVLSILAALGGIISNSGCGPTPRTTGLAFVSRSIWITQSTHRCLRTTMYLLYSLYSMCANVAAKMECSAKSVKISSQELPPRKIFWSWIGPHDVRTFAPWRICGPSLTGRWKTGMFPARFSYPGWFRGYGEKLAMTRNFWPSLHCLWRRDAGYALSRRAIR